MLTLEKIYTQRRLRHTQRLAPLRESTRPFTAVSASVWVHYEKLFSRMLLITACFIFFLSLHFRLNCDAWSPQAEDWLEATPMQVYHARHVQLMAIGWHMQITQVLKFVLFFFVCFFLKFQCTQMQPEIPYLCFRSENLRTKTYGVFI